MKNKHRFWEHPISSFSTFYLILFSSLLFSSLFLLPSFRRFFFAFDIAFALLILDSDLYTCTLYLHYAIRVYLSNEYQRHR